MTDRPDREQPPEGARGEGNGSRDPRLEASRRLRELQERVKTMVDRDSDRAAGVIRNWIRKQGGG